jgi:hypothetical protein
MPTLPRNRTTRKQVLLTKYGSTKNAITNKKIFEQIMRENKISDLEMKNNIFVEPNGNTHNLVNSVVMGNMKIEAYYFSCEKIDPVLNETYDLMLIEKKKNEREAEKEAKKNGFIPFDQNTDQNTDQTIDQIPDLIDPNVNPNINTIVDPDVNTIVDPDVNTIVDHNTNTIVDLNANTIVDPNANTIVDPNKKAIIDSYVYPNINWNSNVCVNLTDDYYTDINLIPIVIPNTNLTTDSGINPNVINDEPKDLNTEENPIVNTNVTTNDETEDLNTIVNTNNEPEDLNKVVNSIVNPENNIVESKQSEETNINEDIVYSKLAPYYKLNKYGRRFYKVMRDKLGSMLTRLDPYKYKYIELANTNARFVMENLTVYEVNFGTNSNEKYYLAFGSLDLKSKVITKIDPTFYAQDTMSEYDDFIRRLDNKARPGLADSDNDSD